MRQLLILFLLSSVIVTYGQVKVASHPLQFKKGKEYHQIIISSNRQNDDVFVFATDKEKTTILKYSPFLFFKDSIVTPRPDIGYKSMVGYSFGVDGNPTIYWADQTYKKIMGVQYNLETKKTTFSFFQLPLNREKILLTFNENNNFYVLTKKDNADALVLYVLKEGKNTPYLLDFSTFEFIDRKRDPITLSMVLTFYPFEKMDTQSYNSLFKGTSKSKVYVRPNDILFTFDHNSFETQLFQLNFKTLQLLERNIPQFPLKRLNGLSNSYYHEGKIYQLTANDEELNFGFKDFDTDAVIKEYHMTKNDTIPFQNSPFYSQVENQRPKVIKTTPKFLNQLSATNLGLTVYKTRKNLFLTIGGNREIEKNNIDRSFLFQEFPEIVPITELQQSLLYFESVFDKKGNPIKTTPEPLAVDFIGRFSYEHPAALLQSTIRHKEYYLHAYYDSKLKEFVLMKFYDGF